MTGDLKTATSETRGPPSFLRGPRERWGERRLANRISRLGKWYEPFHGDPVLQRLVDEIIGACDISIFVETGTFVGDTTKYVALRHRNLKVLTCEINPRWLKLAQKFCRGIDNIEFSLGQSPAFLERSYERLRTAKVLFWLDAHWGDYWPLLDETKIISQLPAFAAIIDDFKVPGKPAFHYDSYHQVENDLALHSKVLGTECFVPDYDPDPSGASLAGYGVFFKNMDYSGLTTIKRLRRISVQPQA